MWTRSASSCPTVGRSETGCRSKKAKRQNQPSRFCFHAVDSNLDFRFPVNISLPPAAQLHGSASTFQAATMYGEPSVSLIR